MNKQSYYNSQLIVNLNKLSSNYHQICRHLPPSTECIPVLKCNAYGAGLLPVAKLLYTEGAKTIALAQISEAIALRNAGLYSLDLLILGGVPRNLFPYAVQYRIGLSVYHPSTVLQLEKLCAEQKVQNLPIHIKIETGLNRTGVKPGEQLEKIIKALQSCTHLTVAGIFSHFSEGELINSPVSHRQYQLFCQAIKQLANAGIRPKLVHICNSGASEWYKDAFLTAVRAGRRLYMDNQQNPGIGGAIEEVCSWRASVTHLHWVNCGEVIGYAGAWRARRRSRIAIICVGYGDGLYPPMADLHAPILVGENRATLLSSCMDQSFVDVTDIPCEVGQEVTLFGESSHGSCLPAQELAQLIGNEGVFFTSLLTDRVERVYL